MIVNAYAANQAKGAFEPFEFELGEIVPYQVDIAVESCGICHSADGCFCGILCCHDLGYGLSTAAICGAGACAVFCEKRSCRGCQNQADGQAGFLAD